MNRTKGFTRRPLLAVDAQGYGRSSELRQHWIQGAVPQVLKEAAEAVGFDRSTWETQAAGDSELAVLPVDESEPKLVDDFVRHLDAALRALNDGREPPAWLRLRAAVHHGTAVRAPSGFSGGGPVEVSRILDSTALKQALRQSPDSCLAVAVSRKVFNAVVAEAYTTLRTNEFREVRVVSKEFNDTVWIRVPGGDVRGLDLGESSAADTRGPDTPGPDGPSPDGPSPDKVGPDDSDRLDTGAAPTPSQQAVQMFTGPIDGSVVGIANIYGP